MDQEHIAIGLLAFGALFALLNAACLLATQLTGRLHSCIPLVGAACMGAGALLLPALRYYAWAALVLDVGTLQFLIAAPRSGRAVWETSWFNLVAEYTGQAGRTAVSLRLFSSGAYVLRWELHRAEGETGLLSMGNVGTWEREDDALVLSYGVHRAVFRATAGDGLIQVEALVEFEAVPGLSLQGVELHRTQAR